jgi:hypothetical protein
MEIWTLEEITKNYKNFDDSKIKELALYPKGLRKEIVPVLNEEIRRRNLGIALIEWVNHETNVFEGLERKQLIEKIKRSTCSACGVDGHLSGYRFHTIISALVTITYKIENLIICETCAKQKKIRSMTTTFLLGWWSKKGFLSTPFVLVSDLANMFRKETVSTEIFDEFIEHHTGVLRIGFQKENGVGRVVAGFNRAQKMPAETFEWNLL